MVAGWQVQELVDLVRERYPDWQSASHAQFTADEITAKRKATDRAKKLLGKGEFSRLLKAGGYDELIGRMEKISRETNLLWNGQPTKGDCAILYAPTLNKWEFCEQMRALIYDKRPSPDKIDTFSDYCQANELPNKWAFATYFLFVLRPHAEVFVKPRSGKWFLQFMGHGDAYTTAPSADMYERYKKLCHGLKSDLKGQGVQDMVEVVSLIWVAARVSQQRVAGIDAKGLVALDRPPHLMREAEATYHVKLDVGGAVEPLGLAACAGLLGRDEEEVGRWQRALERKGQLILSGPPGTGKTFAAQLLARLSVGTGDGFTQTVQFHPAYDYADFMEGIRPRTTPSGQLVYEQEAGLFVRFCQAARERKGACVLLIDEINRANLSQLFGELFYLLEYRESEIQLASGLTFSIPPNVYLIGTMNTADRSIALVDHALRRRFAFIHLAPHMPLLQHYHAGHTELDVTALCRLLEKINLDIDDPHYALGVSYFLTPSLAADLPDIWQMEIEPYLEEYFFNHVSRVAPYRWDNVKQQLMMIN